MSEIKIVLHDLGWSDDLIDHFFSPAVEPTIYDAPEYVLPIESIDVTEMTFGIDEPLTNNSAHVSTIKDTSER